MTIRIRSTWTYAHARGQGRRYAGNAGDRAGPQALSAAAAAAADLRGPKLEPKVAVIALHCSGSSGRQWHQLAEALGEPYAVVAPDLFGCGSKGPWPGKRPFKLAHEAAPVIDMIDASAGPVHLVGHSYGGAVALRAALSRPTRVASLSLYEPVAFHLLKSMGPEGLKALHEFRALMAEIDRAVLAGAYQPAARRFVDYWNGAGAWAALKPDARAELARYIPKACLEARAATEERVSLVTYSRLRMPTLLMQGEDTTDAVGLIVGKLAQLISSASWQVVKDADHMAPMTRPQDVNTRVRHHIAKAARLSRAAPAARAA